MKNIWKKGTAIFLILLAVLQFPGNIVYAENGEKSEIKATISVASNISKQDMQQYLDSFQKKYPGITIEYRYYSDYENEVLKQLAENDYADVLFVPGGLWANQYADYLEPLGTRELQRLPSLLMNFWKHYGR